MTSPKTTDKNRIVLERFLNLAPSLINIARGMIDDASIYDNIIESYASESLAHREQVEYLVMENERLVAEIKKLKTIH